MTTKNKMCLFLILLVSVVITDSGIKGFYETEYWGSPESLKCKGTKQTQTFIPMDRCERLVGSDVVSDDKYATYQLVDLDTVVVRDCYDSKCTNCTTKFSGSAKGVCLPLGNDKNITYTFGTLQLPENDGWVDYVSTRSEDCKNLDNLAQVNLHNGRSCQDSCMPHMGCYSTWKKCMNGKLTDARYSGKGCRDLEQYSYEDTTDCIHWDYWKKHDYYSMQRCILL